MAADGALFGNKLDLPAVAFDLSGEKGQGSLGKLDQRPSLRVGGDQEFAGDFGTSAV